MNIQKEAFQKEIDGEYADLFVIKSKSIRCYISNYGARIVGLEMEDGSENSYDVVLGFGSIGGYLSAEEQYHGAIVGRYANRISNGRFYINDNEYFLAQNAGGNSLHGGEKGFHKKVWKVNYHDENMIIMRYTSLDMEEGFPGELDVEVTYKIKGTDVVISYKATTSKSTVVNLTNHCYWNLNGEGSGDVLNHLLELNADYMTPTNDAQVPTGKLDLVHDTPFDFTSAKTLGADIAVENKQLKYGNGYDHNFVVNQYEKGNVSYVGKIKGDKSRLVMEVWSSEPGVQLYTANHFSGNDMGKNGLPHIARGAFCLETQHFPDSPNISHFPSTRLESGEEYSSTTEYRFGL